MFVIKRNGSTVPVEFDEITKKIQSLCYGLNLNWVNPTLLAQKTIHDMIDLMTTKQLDKLSADIASNLGGTFHEYLLLAGRILMDNIHKNTESDYYTLVQNLYNYKHPRTNEHAPLVDIKLVEFVAKHKDVIQNALDYRKDFQYNFFAVQTLFGGYLLKMNKQVAERIQCFHMRHAIGHYMYEENDDEAIRQVLEYYHAASNMYFTSATPTLYNCGTPFNQLASCFLQPMKDDDLFKIFETVSNTALISKFSGGIGISCSNIRAKGSYIKSTGGESDGIIPMMKVFEATAKYVNQGGRRKGSFAFYLELWHADIFDFLDGKRPVGAEEERCRELFYALWMDDLFMVRVYRDENWSLFCPSEAPGLQKLCGKEFNEKYIEYENTPGKARKVIKARDLWRHINLIQAETGNPYISFKDAANFKSNQKNLGKIISSNLCVAPETYILTDKGQYQIGTLENQQVNVWNGHEFSEVTIKKTASNVELIKVVLSNGVSLECTPEHGFYVTSTYTKNPVTVKKIDAKNLQKGDCLIKYHLPFCQGSIENNIKYPYTSGFYTGDGTVGYTKAGKPQERIALYGEKINLVPFLETRSVSPNKDADGRLNIMLHHDIPPKFTVPINGEVQNKLDWFAGFSDADGTIVKPNGNLSIQITSIYPNFLLQVKLMLQTLGVDSKVTLSQKAKQKMMPNGKDKPYKLFDCKAIYRLLVSSSNLKILIQRGIVFHRLNVSEFKIPQRDATQFIKVVDIIYTNRISDTFCFTESKRSMGMFNGLLTSQCNEVMQYSDENETSVCNLSSLSLPAFVEKNVETGKFEVDHQKLYEITRLVTRNLNRTIDHGYYPIPEAKRSNFRHRPIGIGVQGLANLFFKLFIPFDSEEALKENDEIFETIYFAALTESHDLAVKYGPYETFQGSPASMGKLQYHLAYEFDCLRHEMYPDICKKKPNWDDYKPTSRWDFENLREKIMHHGGLRNSLLLALMPTASSSNIMGNIEAFEAVNSLIYKRRTLSGDNVVICEELQDKLVELNLWSNEMKEKIMREKSVQKIMEIPQFVRLVFKTVFEIKQKRIMLMSARRGRFICQSQSLNLHVENADAQTLDSLMFYAFELGLKTGVYYLRTKPSADAIQFTLATEKKASVKTDVSPKHHPQQQNTIKYEEEDESVMVCDPNDKSCRNCSA